MSSTALTAPSTPALRAANVTCAYPTDRGEVTVLRDVSLSLARGERLAVVGESGAGKSTLLRALNLLVTPARGVVEFEGRALTGLAPAALAAERRHIGMVFQHFALLQRRTVRENVALPLELAGASGAAIARRVDELLDRVRLRDKADARPWQLSGGQRQRVGIARALAHHPRLLLCDEPTSALDAETAQHVVALLRELSVELGLTLVVVTHQMEVARALADTIAVLDRGEVVELTRAERFFAGPTSAAGRRLVGALDRERAAVRDLRWEAEDAVRLTVPDAGDARVVAALRALRGGATLRIEVLPSDDDAGVTLRVRGEARALREAVAALGSRSRAEEVPRVDETA